VPALACFDDGFWARLLPRALVQRATAASAAAQPSRPMQGAAWAVAVLVGVLSVQPVVNLVSPRQINVCPAVGRDGGYTFPVGLSGKALVRFPLNPGRSIWVRSLPRAKMWLSIALLNRQDR